MMKLHWAVGNLSGWIWRVFRYWKKKFDPEQNPKKLKLIAHQYDGSLTEDKDGEPVDLPLIPPL